MTGSELGNSGWARRLAVAAGAFVLLLSLLVLADRGAVAEVPPAAAASFTYVRDPAVPQSVAVSWTEGPSSGTPVAKWRLSIGDPQGVWRSGGCAHGCGFNYPGTGTWPVPVSSSTLSQNCEVSCVLKLEALSAALTPSPPSYLVVQPNGARPPQPSFSGEARNPASPAALTISWVGGATNGTPVNTWKLSQSDGAGGWVTSGYGYSGLGSYPVGYTSGTLPTSCQMACLLKLEALGPSGTTSEPTYRFVGPSSARPPQPTVNWSRDPATPGNVTVSWTPGAANGTLASNWKLAQNDGTGNWSTSTSIYPGVGTFASMTTQTTLTNCVTSCWVKLEALGPDSTQADPVYRFVGPSSARPPAPSVNSTARIPATANDVTLSWSTGAPNGTPVSNWRVAQNDGTGTWSISSSSYPGVGAFAIGTTQTVLRNCAAGCMVRLEATGPSSTLSDPTYYYVPARDGGGSALPSYPTLPAVTSTSVSWVNNEQGVTLGWQYQPGPPHQLTGLRVDVKVGGVWYPWGYRPNSADVTTGLTTTSITLPCLETETPCQFRVMPVGRLTQTLTDPVGQGPAVTFSAPNHSAAPLQVVAASPTSSNNEQAASLPWSAAASTTAIRGYRIEAEADGQWLPWQYWLASPTIAQWSMTTTGIGTGPVTLPCVPTSTSGQCRFRVKAVNWIGEGPASDPITLTQSGLAAAPVATASTSANDQAVSLNWTAPSSPSAIRGYRVELDWNGQWLPWKYSPPNPVGASFAVTTSPGQMSVVVPCRPSTMQAQCKARVSAVNWAGQGPATEVTFNQSPVPEAPKLTYLADAGTSYPTLGWAAPASATAIRGYQIDLGVTVGDTTSWMPWKYSTVMSPEFTAFPTAGSAQLPCWQTTTSRCAFRVRAVNYAGTGPWASTTDMSAAELRGGHNPAIPYCGPCIIKTALGEVLGSQAAAADPVNTATGTYFESFTDLAVPGRGVPLSMERTYDSGAASEDRGLGFGWAQPWSMSIAADSSGATVTHGNGSQVRFTNGVTAGTYQAMPRVQATLAKNTSTGVFTYVLRNSLTYVFNSSGQLTSVTDRNGYVTTITRPQADQVVIADPAGRALTLASTSGRVTSATDPAGHQVGYSYDTSGNLTSVTDVGGQIWTYTYDSAHRLTSKVDPRGGTVTNHYNNAGRVDTQTSALGGITTFDYTSIANATTVADPLGKVHVDYYSGGVLIGQTLAHGTAESGTWNYAYDPLTSAQIRSTDPGGRITRHVVDDHGNPLSVTDPAGHTTSATYNGYDEPLTTTNAAGETTSYTYDSAGNVRTVTRPHAVGQTATTTYLYGDVAHPGDVTGVTDPLNHTTTITYDSNGYRNAVTDPLGQAATWSYDNVGRLIDKVSPRGNELGADPDDYRTTYQTDAYGHTTVITDPLGRASTATYLSTGQVTTTTDGLNQTTAYTYDLAGHLTATTRPDSTVLATGYDAVGNVTSQTDGAGASTTYTYNARNQVASSTDPLSRTSTSAYDTSGRLTTTTDAASQTVSYSHDAAGQVAGLNYSNATTPDVAYAYDAAGRRTTMVDGTGTTSYTYDPAGWLASYTNGNGQSLSYGYDLAGRETTITYPGSRSVTRSYDDADRLAGVTDWASRTTAFSYDADSSLTQIAYPNTVTTTNSYDQAGQLDNIDIANTGGPLAALTYSHRDDGLLASQTPTGISGAGAETYDYDPNSRLSAVNSGAYAYDAADNPTLLAGTAQQFDTANQLCWGATAPTTNTCDTPPTGATTYAFDTSGNRVSRTSPGGDVAAYGYDQANRLTTVTLNSTSVSAYSYDGDGLRQARTVGGTTTHQLWDPNNNLPLLALDGTDAYITGPGGSPLARIDASGTATYIHGDRQGSTRLLTDNTGAVSGTYTYDAWGNTITHTGTAAVPLQYNGQYTDTETGLQYLRVRYYDPSTGQFMSTDAMHQVTRSPYGYALNSPVNSADPSGLAPQDEWNIDSEYRDNNDRYVPLRVGYARRSDGDIKGWGWSKIWAKHAPWWDFWGSDTRADIGQTLANPTDVDEEDGTSVVYTRESCTIQLFSLQLRRVHKVVVEYGPDWRGGYMGVITAFWLDESGWQTTAGPVA